MLKASKEQLELEFEHKKELAQIKSCQNNEIKELKQKYKKKISDLEAKLAKENEILNKALDLACQTLYDINFQMYNTEMDFKEYYKQKALTHQHEDKGE